MTNPTDEYLDRLDVVERRLNVLEKQLCEHCAYQGLEGDTARTYCTLWSSYPEYKVACVLIRGCWAWKEV